MPFPKSSLSGMYDPDRAQGEKIYYGLDNEFFNGLIRPRLGNLVQDHRKPFDSMHYGEYEPDWIKGRECMI